MTQKEFELFDAINCEGLDNSDWMLFRPLMDTSSIRSLFTHKHFLLKENTPYLLLWLEHEKPYPYLSKVIDSCPCDFYEYSPETKSHFYIYNLK